jgi:hypothetical protein
MHKVITPARLLVVIQWSPKSEDFRGKNSPIIKCVRLIYVHICSQLKRLLSATYSQHTIRKRYRSSCSLLFKYNHTRDGPTNPCKRNGNKISLKYTENLRFYKRAKGRTDMAKVARKILQLFAANTHERCDIQSCSVGFISHIGTSTVRRLS